MSVIADWAATTMVLVFGTAFVAKARSRLAFEDFAVSLTQFGLRTVLAQRVTATVVLALEVAACIGLLLLGGHPIARFALPILLLVGFGVGIGLTARGGRPSACHCFGTSTELPAGPHLLLNGALAVLGCLAAGAGGQTGSTGDSVLGIGLGIISGVLFVGAADLHTALFSKAAAGANSAAVERVG
ncbi:MAG: hypothetical protein M3Y42_09465 [Actinomycetota bacterium]|nr:hypothetical protein [Actinomycetota bacterium]MDQ2957178.1 hypothetical protein [Actinomycetota bacterium]